MSGFDGLLSLIPVSDIARQFGIPESVAQSAVEQIIPTVVGGMAANAQDPAGAASLEQALAQHEDALDSGPVSLQAIDTTDGGKIVQNVFGENASQVQAAVAAANPSQDVTKDLVGKLLPILAPIIIAFIAKQAFGQKSAPQSAPQSAPASGPDLGGLLDSILGGGAPQARSGQGGGLEDLLGGLLGGGGSAGGSGDLINVLGGLLGGGKR